MLGMFGERPRGLAAQYFFTFGRVWGRAPTGIGALTMHDRLRQAPQPHPIRSTLHAPRRVQVQLVGDRKNTHVEERILQLDAAAGALKLVGDLLPYMMSISKK